VACSGKIKKKISKKEKKKNLSCSFYDPKRFAVFNAFP